MPKTDPFDAVFSTDIPTSTLMTEIEEGSGEPLFRPARGSASTAVLKSMTDRGGIAEGIRESFEKATGVRAPDPARQYLHEVSDSTQRHPTARLSTPASGHTTGTSNPQGGASTRVVAACSVAEFVDQQARLIEAFREAEHRDPTDGDTEFWQAFRAITLAFAESGSLDRATEPLANTTPTPVKKRRKRTPAQAKRSAVLKSRIARLSPVAQAPDITAYRR